MSFGDNWDRGSAARAKSNELLKSYYHALRAKNPTAPVKAADFYPVGVEDIARSLGWSIDAVDGVGADQSFNQYPGKCNFDTRTIFVDLKLSPGERRLTLAHEIGHISLHARVAQCQGGVLHRTRSTGRRERSSRVPSATYRVEREAEIFGVELLMPAKAVRAHLQRLFSTDAIWTKSDLALKLTDRRSSSHPSAREVSEVIAGYSRGVPPSDTRSLCDFFGVSKAAMAARLRELGLVVELGS